MLIYEIVRYIINSDPRYTLNYTFSSGNGLISVVLIWINQLTEILKFRLNPETAIKENIYGS